MEPVHRMNLESDNGAEMLFCCPEDGCGRRIVRARTGCTTWGNSTRSTVAWAGRTSNKDFRL